MPDFVALTEAETDADSFMRQSLGKKIKDNFDNHETRIISLTEDVRLFDHFTDYAEDSKSLPLHEVIGTNRIGPRWIYNDDSGASFTRLSAKPHWSTGLFTLGEGINREALTWSRLRFEVDDITRPVSFKHRFKWNGHEGAGDIILSPIVGLMVFGAVTWLAPQRGVWLQSVDETNWRFRSKDASATFNGSSFAQVAPNTWTEVELIWDASPNQVRCFVDSVLKETITSNLPSPDVLRFIFGAVTANVGDATSSAAYEYTFDRSEGSLEGGPGDAP